MGWEPSSLINEPSCVDQCLFPGIIRSFMRFVTIFWIWWWRDECRQIHVCCERQQSVLSFDWILSFQPAQIHSVEMRSPTKRGKSDSFGSSIWHYTEYHREYVPSHGFAHWINRRVHRSLHSNELMPFANIQCDTESYKEDPKYWSLCDDSSLQWLSPRCRISESQRTLGWKEHTLFQEQVLIDMSIARKS